MTFDPRRHSLLPELSTPLELALEGVVHERLLEDLGDRTLMNVYDVDMVPAVLLPLLAWQWALDVWDPSWSEAQQREALRNVPETMGARGTAASVRGAVRPWSAALEIVEWWQEDPPADPYTFTVKVSEGTAPLLAIEDAINRTMPLRCSFTMLPGYGLRSGVAVGVVLRAAALVTVSAQI